MEKITADIVADFIAAMVSAGVVPAEPIADKLLSEKLVRFRCEGDSKSRKNGWAILHLDARPAGAFGNYKQMTGTVKWKADFGAQSGLTPQERAKLHQEWQDARERRRIALEAAQRGAAMDAKSMWLEAEPVNEHNRHPYLEAKGIVGAGLRTLGDLLLVPMFDENGLLWNLQRIWPDGRKLFLKHGRVDGLFHIIGQFRQRGEQCAFVEGYATGDTVHRASNYPVVVTFNTANMGHVARLWNKLRPDLHYTIYADDDEATAREFERTQGKYRNPGVETAQAIAEEIGARIAYPLGSAQAKKG